MICGTLLIKNNLQNHFRLEIDDLKEIRRKQTAKDDSHSPIFNWKTNRIVRNWKQISKMILSAAFELKCWKNTSSLNLNSSPTSIGFQLRVGILDQSRNLNHSKLFVLLDFFRMFPTNLDKIRSKCCFCLRISFRLDKYAYTHRKRLAKKAQVLNWANH